MYMMIHIQDRTRQVTDVLTTNLERIIHMYTSDSIQVYVVTQKIAFTQTISRSIVILDIYFAAGDKLHYNQIACIFHSLILKRKVDNKNVCEAYVRTIDLLCHFFG